MSSSKKTVRIDRTRHKKQPFTVTKVGRVEQVLDERYKTEYSACRGAVRACRDFLKGGNTGVLDRTIRILLPNDRERTGSLWRDGSIHFTPIIRSTTKR